MLLLRPVVAAAMTAIGISINVISFDAQIDSASPITDIFQTTVLVSANLQQPIPITEVIKAFGRLAGPECYGKRAPPGSSCQITEQDIDRVFGGSDTATKNGRTDDISSAVLTEEQFKTRLKAAPFQWPLKPFGVSKDASLAKTASMNKGAETRVYMDLLEERQLYNPRDPTGPLPTSLRPKLNRLLQDEGIDQTTMTRVFLALNDGKSPTIDVKELRRRFEGHPMDYYEFLELVGKDSITWPY